VRSVYIVGGPGAGKSTFMAQLLDGVELGPLEELHSTPNVRGALVTLRGHRLSDGGVYVGKMRPLHPGTDGLDRASTIAGAAWVEAGPPFRYIVGEGTTLTTRGFLGALAEHTELLVPYLTVDEETRARRFAARGSVQTPTFVNATIGRAASAASYTPSMEIDSTDPDAWELGLDLVKTFLGKY
jgi:hypothetical protein